jgi:hypothetical protein
MLLLLAANLGEKDTDMINTRYLARLFSNDWGFYYTATANLQKVKRACASVSVLSEAQRQSIGSKIDQILSIIEKEPKSGGWKKRAQVGPSKIWYNEVSDW